MKKENKLKFFGHIPSKPDIGLILTRLGYKKTVTVISKEYRQKINSMIEEGLALCDIKGIYGRYKIKSHEHNGIKIFDDIFFESKNLSKLLKNSFEVVLMATTVGDDITKKIHSEIKSENADFALILDSLGSQIVDGGLDWMVEFINKEIRREGKKLTGNRYSPGYGDFLLSNQKIIYDILNLKKLDIEITQKYMLVPEKSVIAIAGIEGIE
ncbi:methionine synthase [Herbivorax sp. ANBcel31]|uniref:methionine synthase n=1 Tax=Herbivorax sp. ANBcel31 TaxID=3069754 RepID=UPI0027B1E273|nr:methionine synthase [Herbivorax sp. ANBcel31]MDQ2086612.1 methionine synthase [Herbivorax sp. ANBcel31]